MEDGPREKENEGKIFCDEDGQPYDELRILTVFSQDNPFKYSETFVWYKEGKIHGKPGIMYPDGLEEIWEDGKYIGVYRPPRHLRERLEGT